MDVIGSGQPLHAGNMLPSAHSHLHNSATGIINRGDSFRRRRSRSNSLAATSPQHSQAPSELRGASSGGGGGSKSNTSKQPVETHHVYMLGASGVGKVALISQFTTSECINAYEGPGEFRWDVDDGWV